MQCVIRVLNNRDVGIENILAGMEEKRELLQTEWPENLSEGDNWTELWIMKSDNLRKKENIS